MRGLFVAALFFLITPLLIFIQWVLRKLHSPGWGVISVRYYSTLCTALRIRVLSLPTPNGAANQLRAAPRAEATAARRLPRL